MSTFSKAIRGVRDTTLKLDVARDPNRHAYREFDRVLQELLQGGSVSAVLDVGGGRGAMYDGVFPRSGVFLTVADIDADELALNTAADATVVADITKPGVYLGDRLNDLVTIRAGVEHFSDNQVAVSNVARALSDDGYLLCTFASRWAPFSVINRLLPPKLSVKLLNLFVPDSDGILGFRAYYDRCTKKQYEEILELEGLSLVKYYCSFDSSWYFASLPPVYVVSRLFDTLRRRIGRPELASYHMFLARKVANSEG